MNEKAKTLTFVIIAGLVVLGVWLTRPSFSDDDATDMRGKILFPDFKKAQAAVSLDIVKYDETNGDVIPFKVAQVGGVWSIPSHDNYPADAKEHLAEAATSLMDLKVLGTASENPGDHAEFGVVNPTDENLTPGSSGVGMRVTLKDKNDKTLADLIIGKPDPDDPGLRYVRRVDQAPVYTVALSTDKLSTEFGDWIEKDLLKLNTWDLAEVFIQQYSIDEVRGEQLQSGKITLGYDDQGEVKWKLLSDQQFIDDRWQDVKLGPDQELNTEKLDAMQSALDDLKIVDVARKPAGLSAVLAADKTSFKDLVPFRDVLLRRGFYAADVGGKKDVYSNEGEIRVLMKDGVEYVLRFGGIAGSSNHSEKTADGKPSDVEGVNRYLFVTAEFNPKAIAKPELEPLPSEMPKKEAVDQPKGDADKAAGDEKAEPATEPEKQPDEEKKVDLNEERQRIEKENKRKQEQYDEKIAQGKKQVAELNARMADWYYVISESVYKRIHLGRDDIIKEKPKEGDDAKTGPATPPNPLDALAPDAFEQLQQDRPGGSPAEK
ncbi:MAG: DUF4340 domain-containing protein [Pirellulales bacterium]|nr:DUF4340 domain-containing protein [Pirellulales bacterium]